MKKLNETMDGTFTLPNAESYSNAILAFAKCPNGALLQEMVEQYNAGALVQSEPELIAFNGVISAWARVGRTNKAKSVLWLMDTFAEQCQSLVPDVLTYNSVLHTGC